MDKNFKEIKKLYNDARNRESQKIVERLRKEGFKAKGSRGAPNYKSQGKMDSAYDLGIWKWIVAEKEGITAVINLQTLEQDSNTKNIHVLFDRISIDVFKDNEGNILSVSNDLYFQSVKSRYKVENEFDPGFFEKAITGLELPLGDDDLESLVDIIKEKIKKITTKE